MLLLTRMSFTSVNTNLCSEDPWVADDEYIPCDFQMPSTHLDKLMLRVFEDFCMHRRYFLTSGVKFGGHFLAYPGTYATQSYSNWIPPLRTHAQLTYKCFKLIAGEPTKHHAEFIIHCEDLGRDAPEVLLKAQERLALGVRKTLLFARLNPQNDKLTYRCGRTCY